MTDIPFRVEPTATPGDAPLGYEQPRDGRARLTVRAGQRPTGGHSISVMSITRGGSRLTVSCAVRAPAPGAIVTQVLTWLAQTISIDESLIRGIRDVMLVDQTGAELAHVSRISA